MARKKPTLSDLLNNLTFKCIFDKYRLVAVNAFEWDGLPEGIREEHIERLLFSRGRAVFFRDPRMSWMCLEGDDSGQVNVYGDPLGYIVHGFNYNRRLSAEECVVIENNKLRLATEPFVMFYTNKIAEAERTMDVNIKACKTPVVFACDDKDVLTFKRIFQQVDGNAPAIFADRGLNLDSIQAYQTGAKFLGNDLSDYVNSVESDLLTFLGLNNTAVDKKERLITDEAEANNQLISSFADLQLEARQRACEAINAMWPDLNITVKRRQTPVEKPVDTVEGGGDNG